MPATVQGGVQHGVRVWTISYALPPRAPSIAGQSTAISVTEFPPSRRSHLKAGRDTLQIHGRRVRLRRGTAQVPASVATWVTTRATYVVLDNGATTHTLRQLVSCLP
jgi:hypothetical protein